jgi:hypothetical protein
VRKAAVPAKPDNPRNMTVRYSGARAGSLPSAVSASVADGRWLIGRGLVSAPPMRCCPSERAASAPGAVDEARERLRSASLASTDQTEPTEPLSACPRTNGRVVIELVSGTVIPDRCRASLCPYCLPLNARRRALAITYARPQRMIRLSLMATFDDASPGSVAVARMKLIRRNLKRFGIAPGEWCWTLEKNPEGTGYHAHCIQRGRWIDQEALQEACLRSDAGIPYINKIWRTSQWTSRYGLKGFGADGYGLKTFRPNADSTEALRINNGKMEHHSTGFFAIDGETVRVRQMESNAIAEMNGFTRTAFVGAASTEVDRILGSPKLRTSLVRDANSRSTAKLRCMV